MTADLADAATDEQAGGGFAVRLDNFEVRSTCC